MPAPMNMTEANQARLASFKKNSRVIKGVSFLGTFDGNCCAICAALDGTQWDLDGHPINGHTIAFQMPPIHDDCRCVLTPIPKTFRDIGLNIDEPKDVGMRASSLGPIKGDTTFEDFLKQQPPEFADKVLGRERAALVRDGSILLRELISDNARLLTLDELASLIAARQG